MADKRGVKECWNILYKNCQMNDISFETLKRVYRHADEGLKRIAQTRGDKKARRKLLQDILDSIKGGNDEEG
jgi:hypothetical protein